MWFNSDVALLLNLTLEYKVKGTQENTISFIWTHVKKRVLLEIVVLFLQEMKLHKQTQKMTPNKRGQNETICKQSRFLKTLKVFKSDLRIAFFVGPKVQHTFPTCV